ncbi:MAG TPA: hypothetical protein PLU30_27270 [Verrucomicrobiae bacterium]|nr:hypothetical protein [Verrucomicrobiae bacterium]
MNVQLLGSQAGETGFTAPIWQDGTGRIFFVADCDEDNDGPNGNPTRDPYWQSETTLRHQGKSIDSMRVPGVVAPTWLPRAIPAIVLGCRARVTNLATGLSADGVVYDLGPSKKAGECSNLLCARLGAKGGENRPLFFYELWPGVPADVDGVRYALQPSK